VSSPLTGNLGRRFIRLVTDAAVRSPRLWRIFRPLVRRQFDAIAEEWDIMRTAGHLAPYEAALAGVDPVPRTALDLGTGTGQAAFALARRFPEVEVTGVDLAERMLAEAERKTPPDLRGRVRFEGGDAAGLAYADGSFDLVAHANMIPFFDELTRVLAVGGQALFAFSAGAQTPIYVPTERLREELQRRGFTEFAEFQAGSGIALLARKGDRA
jgi:SAM-dependent methyltransferase